MKSYLIYEDCRNYQGLYHRALNLQALIKEAIYLNRIPVSLMKLHECSDTYPGQTGSIQGTHCVIF